MGDLAGIAADYGGIEITTTSFIERDDMLLFFDKEKCGAPRDVEIKFKPDDCKSVVDWQMRAYFSMLQKTLKRPSWLHPIKRVLWVHHHGPHRPTVRVAEKMDLKSFGVVKNIA
jgi:hypothetical protein